MRVIDARKNLTILLIRPCAIESALEVTVKKIDLFKQPFLEIDQSQGLLFCQRPIGGTEERRGKTIFFMLDALAILTRALKLPFPNVFPISSFGLWWGREVTQVDRLSWQVALRPQPRA